MEKNCDMLTSKNNIYELNNDFKDLFCVKNQTDT